MNGPGYESHAFVAFEESGRNGKGDVARWLIPALLQMAFLFSLFFFSFNHSNIQRKFLSLSLNLWKNKFAQKCKGKKKKMDATTFLI